MAHRDLHPEPVDECFGCKVLSINIGAGALENRGAAVREADGKDRQLDRDLHSYRDMRKSGLQPKQIDGSADLASKVNDQFDIDLGVVVPKKEKTRVKDGFAFAKEAGLMS